MTNAAIYSLPTFTGLMRHGRSSDATFVRDEDQESKPTEMRPTAISDVDVQVWSGDYFATLATSLDTLNRGVKDSAVRNDIEDHVSDLIYLQDNYKIVKKNHGRTDI